MKSDRDDRDKLHSGHRGRLRDRFLSGGLDSFEPHVILELILFYAIPQKDTNPIAHSLLEHFNGSLADVLDAPVEELMKVPGLGKNGAVLLKMFPEVCRRYLIDQRETGRIIKNEKDAASFLVPLFIGKRNEIVTMLCMDSKGKVLFCDRVFEGSVNAAVVSVRRIVELSVRYATTDVILAHNHPGGTAIPSEQDVMVTQKVSDALSVVGIRLCDHIIVAGHDWVSLAATPTLSGLFSHGRGY